MLANKSETEIVDMSVEDAIELLFNYLKDVIYYPKQAKLEPDKLPEPFVRLGQGLLYFGQSLIEARQLSRDIARGQLDTNPVSSGNEIASDFKSLQSTLKHLTWQINHVAKGDYKQRVSYIGEFSEAINDMIKQLDERTTALNNELESSRQKADELRENNNLFEAITQSIAQCIVVVDRKSRRWLYSNHELSRVLRNLNEADVMRSWIADQIDLYEVDASSQLTPQIEEVSFSELLASKSGAVAADSSANVNFAARQFFSAMRYPMTWHGEKALAFVFTDITEEKSRRIELESAAFYDTLTGTYSRLFGMNTLDEWIKNQEHFILAFVDMDSLKYVNDTFGHSEGDAYILGVTQMLRCFDISAIVSRLGGDEFMILAKGWSKADANKKLESIREALMGESNEKYERSISYGVVEVTPDSQHQSSLILSMADEIMYDYKRSRKMERRITM